jgi:predicted nucleic acid-binding protein
VTDVKIVDASALAALLFGEAEATLVARRLTGARLMAPALLRFEITNACVTKARRHPDQTGSLLAALQLALAMEIETVAVDFPEVAALAAATGLTGYDASYLWVARATGAELVTLDRQLARVDREYRVV